MKPYLKSFLTLLFAVNASLLTYNSYAQCGAGYTQVAVNWDWQYFDTLPASSFRFTFGKSAMQLKWTGTNTINGTTGAHTGSGSGFGTGDDLKFVVGNGADTLIFD